MSRARVRASKAGPASRWRRERIWRRHPDRRSRTAGSAAGQAGVGGSAGGASAGGGGAPAGTRGPTPLLWWTFDGDGTNSGAVAGYPLSLTGPVTFVAGKFGAAAQFGSGAFGMVQGSARGVLGAYPQYTISFWVNATLTPDTTHPIFDFYNRSAEPYGGIQFGYPRSEGNPDAPPPGHAFSMCAATTGAGLGCVKFSGPEVDSWHNVIIRYAGTSTISGGGARVEVYYDGHYDMSLHNDAQDPVFTTGISDVLYIGTGGITLDDMRIYNTVFTPPDQCTEVIGGTWDGSSGLCTLP
jgi:concanavalin A-like lectin/glucanase superfamily protein